MKFKIFNYAVTIEKIEKQIEEYHIIIGGYTKVPIGLTTARADVLAEEPEASFVRITKKQYTFLNKLLDADGDCAFEKEAARLAGLT